LRLLVSERLLVAPRGVIKLPKTTGQKTEERSEKRTLSASKPDRTAGFDRT